MQRTKPTEHLTGITFQGDFDDFYDLAESIYNIVGDDENPNKSLYGVKLRSSGQTESA